MVSDLIHCAVGLLAAAAAGRTGAAEGGRAGQAALRLPHPRQSRLVHQGIEWQH